MLADLIREFCNTNNYEVIENYSGSTFLGEMVTTLAFIVKPDRNFFDALEQLSSFLAAKEIDDSAIEELEGTNVDYVYTDSVDADAVVYFPFIKDYHP
ncbi:hypothetical protein D1159_01615 [Pseudoflavonifractor sp. 524-17]|uniref:hypothetical protein n=1 Tax=Pseudoflavonifractor sp. 524-17 TaxID=2304577 RepID=UPI00137B4CC2|nr:hypothetical protein [Pseudoflavonifractor sp. 524-17]NCE63303.1 hypothetical protein [Pseudoflavonifractor sp. 524-17]